jgi:glycosyltransferase involved in cell wall biosynthesis
MATAHCANELQAKARGFDAEPLVSVITATRNRPSLLQLALNSIARQTLGNFEAIVVDDGSDQSVLAEYDKIWANLDSRFALHFARPCGTKGTGPSATRNFGLRLARGQFVAFLDDDDEWILPDYLAAGVAAMSAHQADYLVANMQGMKRGTVHTPDWFFNAPALVAGKRVSDTPRIHEVPLPEFVAAMQHYIVHPNQSIIRRRLLEDVGGFMERLNIGEDYHLMMRVADRAQRILYRPDVAVAYRFPEGNSVSLAVVRQEHLLQGIFGAEHLRTTCRNRVVRRFARAREAWCLRELSQHSLASGWPGEACWFAWQSAATFPTLGAGYFLTKTVLQALFHHHPKETSGEGSAAHPAKSI